MPYNSLQAFDVLVASGMPESQARAIAHGQEQWRANLVSRADLAQFESRLKRLISRGMLIQSTVGITIAATAVVIAKAI